MDNRPIGVFDSGIGGLTVVNALAKTLPQEVVVYVGDTARVPYGNKSTERIQQYSEEITKWLIKQGCKMIVVACNTASSQALDGLKSKFDIPIIGVIEPGIEAAIHATQNHRIGVLGTYGTIRSDAYGQALRKLNENISVISQACPLFVPLAEEGWVSGDVPETIAKTYLENIIASDVDTLILGCTHYPLLKPTINKVMGGKVNLVDSGETTAAVVRSVLNKLELYPENGKSGEIFCRVTDSVELFESLAGRFLDAPISNASHIDIF